MAVATALLNLRSGGVKPRSPSYQFQKKGGKVTMTSPILLLRSGREWSWLPPHLFQKEGGIEAMTSALLSLGGGGVPGEWRSVP